MLIGVVFEQRYGWARAYRDGRLVAGRVRLTVDHDVRVGLAPRERRRRSLRASFTERVDPALRAELAALKFAAHRQLARWGKNRDSLRPRQREQRSALVSAVRTLEHPRFGDGVELRPVGGDG